MTRDALAYNQARLNDGDVGAIDITRLTEFYQQSVEGLKVDGKYGPLTRRVLLQESAAPLHGLAALEVMKGLIGRGESGGNNVGPDIEEWLAGDGTERPTEGPWLWCAVVISFCLLRGAEQLGLAFPYETSRGARDLVRKLIRGGGQEIALEFVQPGDIVAIARRGGHHVFIVELVLGDGVVGTIEGNVGRPPAKVKRLTRDLHNEDVYAIVRV